MFLRVRLESWHCLRGENRPPCAAVRNKISLRSPCFHLGKVDDSPIIEHRANVFPNATIFVVRVCPPLVPEKRGSDPRRLGHVFFFIRVIYDITISHVTRVSLGWVIDRFFYTYSLVGNTFTFGVAGRTRGPNLTSKLRTFLLKKRLRVRP